MFTVGTGVGKNGFYNMVMQSTQDADALIKWLTVAVNKGWNPNTVFDEAVAATGANMDDMLPEDRARVKREIEKLYR